MRRVYLRRRAVQASSFSPPAAASQSASSQGIAVDTVGSVFLWVPTLDTGVKAKPFRSTVLQEPQVAFTLFNSISQLRALLRKRSLTQVDANSVVFFSEQLADFAWHRMNSPIQKNSLSRMAEKFGYRFLTFYVLDMASRAVRQEWRPGVSTTLPEGVSDDDISPLGFDMWLLTKRLAAATELYKAGRRPSDEEILHLMRKLFCLPGAPGRFKEKIWDAWRQDAGC
ncbi:hypothetical protein Efla_001672 [Eimeria flavescens]